MNGTKLKLGKRPCAGCDSDGDQCTKGILRMLCAKHCNQLSDSEKHGNSDRRCHGARAPAGKQRAWGWYTTRYTTHMVLDIAVGTPIEERRCALVGIHRSRQHKRRLAALRSGERPRERSEVAERRSWRREQPGGEGAHVMQREMQKRNADGNALENAEKNTEHDVSEWQVRAATADL